MQTFSGQFPGLSPVSSVAQNFRQYFLPPIHTSGKSGQSLRHHLSIFHPTRPFRSMKTFSPPHNMANILNNQMITPLCSHGNINSTTSPTNATINTPVNFIYSLITFVQMETAAAAIKVYNPNTPIYYDTPASPSIP